MSIAADLHRFLDGLAVRLRQDVAAGPPGLASFADQVARLTGGTPAATPQDLLPVTRHWPAALDAIGAGWARPLAGFAAALCWAQNPNYRRQPPDPAFLDSYGYAVVAGPAAGPPALIACESLALGVLLLAPGTHYPLHSHPAPAPGRCWPPISGGAISAAMPAWRGRPEVTDSRWGDAVPVLYRSAWIHCRMTPRRRRSAATSRG